MPRRGARVGRGPYSGRVFEIQIQAEFSAAHAISIAGTREAVHGHNWQVVATLAGESLDADGLLCDFHTAGGVLDEIIGPFNNRDLNRVAPFDRENPSAENVARYIAEELQRRLGDALEPHARVRSVSVTEAPRCVATYRLF